jgi:hypothetical protein
LQATPHLARVFLGLHGKVGDVLLLKLALVQQQVEDAQPGVMEPAATETRQDSECRNRVLIRKTEADAAARNLPMQTQDGSRMQEPVIFWPSACPCIHLTACINALELCQQKPANMLQLILEHGRNLHMVWV